MKTAPAYLQLLSSGDFASRVTAAYEHLAACDICPLKCRANRLEDQYGVCQTGLRAQVAGYDFHPGEEAPLSGWKGSGTIFFTRCNLHCVYCQNDDISQGEPGREMEPEQLAEMMLKIQAGGCHNINLVSPTHVVPQIMAAIMVAAQAGLHLPIVYNSGGYDSLEMLALLDGIVDIYMPDMKYADEATARKYSKIPHYPQVNQAAVREMYRQVGDLQLDDDGLAVRGLLVRHLLLPNGLAGTQAILRFLVDEISPHVYLNLMDQYHPAFHACNYPELSRPLHMEEYRQAFKLAQEMGLKRLDRSSRWL